MKIQKQKLIDLNYVIDNEYLDKYIELINSNEFTKSDTRKTQKHHIIMRSFSKYNGEKTNDSEDNLVYLSYSDHILAHYYLALCTVDKFRYKSELAFYFMTNDIKLPSLKNLFKKLPMYEKIYESYIIHHSESLRGHITTDETKKKISLANTGKRRNDEQKRIISEATKTAMQNPELSKRNSEYHKGTIWVNNGKKSKQIKPDNLEEYLNNGWKLKRLSFSNKAIENMTKANQKIANFKRHKITYVTNELEIREIKKEDLENFLKQNPGWRLGQKKHPERIGSKHMNNGKISKIVPKEKINEYLDNGWKFGLIKHN